MSTYPTPHDDLTCPNVREVATLRKRVEELEGEARVLIGCPCLCHTGQYGEPHLDCRECVRGCATPSAIDHDHEWALWCEKWRAALDLVGNAQARAEKAEAQPQEAELRYAREFATRVDFQERAEKAEQERDDWRAAATTHIETIGILSDQKIQLQADLDAALVLCVASDWDVEVLGAGYEPEVYKAHAHVLPLLEKRREGRG